MPERPVRQYWQEAGIQTDQDDQYCCVTDEEARGEYYSLTPEQYETKGGVAAPEDEDARANQ
jgi:hypothetical protein